MRLAPVEGDIDEGNDRVCWILMRAKYHRGAKQPSRRPLLTGVVMLAMSAEVKQLFSPIGAVHRVVRSFQSSRLFPASVVLNKLQFALTN
ncbi:MAG: hypothetical protein CMJ50_10500 [Planctomycetaceae bacterium]|nr:hypothetical protein [Planctomycetaceae bacterium]